LKPKAKDRGGRPRKRAVQAGEKVQIGVRISPALRGNLEKAAARSGRSLTQEAELRLERSFERQDILAEALTLAFDRHTAGLVMVLARAMEATGRVGSFISNESLKSHANWRNDPFAYQEATLAVDAIMKAFRPTGDVVRPPLAKLAMFGAKPPLTSFGESIADELIQAIQSKPPPELASWAATVRELLTMSPKEKPS
jgi:TraY domain